MRLQRQDPGHAGVHVHAVQGVQNRQRGQGAVGEPRAEGSGIERSSPKFRSPGVHGVQGLQGLQGLHGDSSVRDPGLVTRMQERGQGSRGGLERGAGVDCPDMNLREFDHGSALRQRAS